ncbi:TonB family protein [Colwelliaceae bacterium MEBiC 14330]
MTNSNFDKDITELYQQRKAQVVAPTIVFPKSALASKFHPAKLLSLLLAGGIASFGVMAIITHLASPKVNQTSVKTLAQNIDLIAIAAEQPEPKPVIPVKPLPPKPQSKVPNHQQTLQTQAITADNNVITDLVDVNSLVSVAVLPELSEPEVAIEPTLKVLPKYSLSARQAKQTGEITLRYQINATGHTKNITVLSSNVTRELQRSAQKALAQWRYTPNKQLSGEHQVVFKFALTEE